MKQRAKRSVNGLQRLGMTLAPPNGLFQGGDEPFLDTAVYHCQQAAEKALKAYLTLKDAPFQRFTIKIQSF